MQLLRQDSRVLAMLLKSLVDASLESRCFQAPFALAVLAEAKERTSFQAASSVESSYGCWNEEICVYDVCIMRATL